MATTGIEYLTLADWAKRLDPDGKVDAVAELLSQTNTILSDMPYVQGNLPTGHKSTIRVGLPSATWRMLNYGVQPTKSATAQVTDTCGMLETYAEVDKDLADLNGNTSSFRLSEDRAHVESMNQEMASTLFYGNTNTDPEKFMGLAPRFNALSGAGTSDNVLSGAGTGSDNTSVWLICWGPETIFGIFPKGSKAGLQQTDLGEVTLDDANGGHYQGYRTHYKWNNGLVVRDWRYAVRICNIDVSDLTKDAATGADLIDLMVQAIELLPEVNMGRPVFYCNRTVRSFLRRQVVNKVANSTLAMDTVAGRKVVTLGDIPVQRVDAILSTEARVS